VEVRATETAVQSFGGGKSLVDVEEEYRFQQVTPAKVKITLVPRSVEVCPGHHEIGGIASHVALLRHH
jgi:hypothetical protein